MLLGMMALRRGVIFCRVLERVAIIVIAVLMTLDPTQQVIEMGIEFDVMVEKKGSLEYLVKVRVLGWAQGGYFI